MPKISTYSLDTTITDNDSLLGINSADGSTKRFAMVSIKTYVASVASGTGLSGGVEADTITLNVEAAQTGITSILATDLKIGEDDQTKIDFETANEIHFYANNVEQVYLGDNIFGPQTDSDVDLGSTGVRWKDAYIDSITVTGEIDGASLDISGNADIDGTLEADAITINGVTLAETISDTVGTMVGSNTETGIAVTYDDSDNTLDFVIGAGSIVNSMLADDAVGADELASNAVVTASITDGNVTTAKLAADSVTSAKIPDNAIDSEHYTDGSIDTAHIADSQITVGKMAANSVDSDQYVDGSIDNAHLADDAVGADELAANAVVTASITDNNVTHAKLENRYTAKATSTATGSQNLDASAATTFLLTGNVATATLTIQNLKLGQVVDIVCSGTLSSAVITLATDFSTTTIRKVGSIALDQSVTNVITVACIDDTDSAALLHYTIAPFATDTTP